MQLTGILELIVFLKGPVKCKTDMACSCFVVYFLSFKISVDGNVQPYYTSHNAIEPIRPCEYIYVSKFELLYHSAVDIYLISFVSVLA